MQLRLGKRFFDLDQNGGRVARSSHAGSIADGIPRLSLKNRANRSCASLSNSDDKIEMFARGVHIMGSSRKMLPG